MGSSPGFESTTWNLAPYSDSLSLWLHHFRFNPPVPISRRLILQQAHGHPISRAPIACKLTVSCSISLPSRGSFHLSLTVLVHYRWPKVFSLGGWSPQIPTGFLVSRGTQQHARSLLPFAYRTITFYGCPFQEHLAKERFSYSLLTL